MAFKVERFMEARFSSRTQEVELGDLAEWFDGDPRWTVRGLTGPELARVNDSVQVASNREAMAAALMEKQGGRGDKTEALQRLLGLGSDLPDDYVRRLEMLIAGSVDPPCDRQLAVRLAEKFPVEFYQLTNAIMQLTGKGHRVGESNGSGETPSSELLSPSGTTTEGASTN